MNKSEIRDRILRIADEIPLKLGDMTIQTADSNKLLVTGWTNTVHFENIKKDSVLRELQELKATFNNLIDTCRDLTNIIEKNDLIVEYHMAYDARKTGIGLCSELKGELNWYL